MTTALKDGKGFTVERIRETVVVGQEGDHEVVEPGPEKATIYLYDILGEDFLGGIPARQVIEGLATLEGTPDLEIRLNSPGGDVFEGIAIYNALSRFPGKVTVHVDGLAASIASLVALAGDKTIVAENAMVMVHRPWTVLAGDAEELRRQAEALDKAWSAMLTTYARRTGRRAATLVQRVSDQGGEWWMTAEEAVAEGFADATEKPEKAAAVFGLERFKRVPERLAARAGTVAPEETPTLPRTAEIVPPRVERPLPDEEAPPQATGPSREARRRILDILRLTI